MAVGQRGWRNARLDNGLTRHGIGPTSGQRSFWNSRYEASDRKGELPYAVNYTIWIPPGVKTLRGVVVHQHGCGTVADAAGVGRRRRAVGREGGPEATQPRIITER